jgi:CelD/BcsL family acetyltransferase involved in cellulose biosynthesis
MESVIHILTEYLLAKRRFDLIVFGPLMGCPRQGEDLAAALESVAGRLWSEMISKANHMAFSLPTTFDMYRDELSKKERSNIRRDRRDLERTGAVEHKLCTRQTEVVQALDTFISLHQRQWQRRGKLGHFGDWPGATDFHREMAERQSVKRRTIITQLSVNGRLVASEYGYCFGCHAHWLLSARRGTTGGRTAFAEMIRFLISNGITELDALRGRYEYKQRLGAAVVPSLCILAGPRGWYRSQRVRLARSVAWLVDAAYYRLWYSRWARRMPYWRRPLWGPWIRAHFLAY